MVFVKRFWTAFLIIFAVSSCQIPPIIAQMTANIDITNQANGVSQNTVANVNFNQVSRQIINNQTVLQFSNTDGYAIQFQLATPSVSAQTYSMGSSHSLTGSFTLTNQGQKITVQVISTGQGQLVINSINAGDQGVSSMSGNFEVNIGSTNNEEQSATGVLVGVINF